MRFISRKTLFVLSLLILVLTVLGVMYKSKMVDSSEKNITVNVTKEVSIITNKAENEKEALNLLTAKYLQAEIKNNIRYGYKIEDIDRKYPIECLRKSKDQYYSIHLLKEGGVFYTLFTYDKNMETYVVRDFWLYNGDIHINQFSTLVKGKSTFDDVCKIDKDSNALLTSMDTISTHKTADGYEVRVIYEGNEKSLVVSNIDITRSEKFSVYKNLFQQDMPSNLIGK